MACAVTPSKYATDIFCGGQPRLAQLQPNNPNHDHWPLKTGTQVVTPFLRFLFSS